MNIEHVSDAAATPPLVIVPVIKQEVNVSRWRMRFPPMSFGTWYVGAGTEASWQRVSVFSRRVPLSKIVAGLSDAERAAVARARANLLESIRTQSTDKQLSPLTYYRLRARLTQYALAEKTELQQSKISFYENNPDRMTTQAAKKLATALGVDFRELLS